MRTTIVIEDALMAEALEKSGLTTKRDVIEAGLRLLIRRKDQERIRTLRGNLRREGDLEKSRLDS